MRTVRLVPWSRRANCTLIARQASDVSCEARADASIPAPGGGLDPLDEALDDGCLFPVEAAR
jgi:hypothetical protein